MDVYSYTNKNTLMILFYKKSSLSEPDDMSRVTHTTCARARERERERDRPLRDYAFTRGLYFNGFGASPPILSILCASYSS